FHARRADSGAGPSEGLLIGAPSHGSVVARSRRLGATAYAGGQRMRILVIEDDPAIGKLVRIAFERDGQDVVHAATGTEGLEMTRNWGPDVVLLDLGLPDMGGLEVTRKIRGESDVPILILTARGLEDERVKGLDLGADD